MNYYLKHSMVITMLITLNNLLHTTYGPVYRSVMSTLLRRLLILQQKQFALAAEILTCICNCTR